MKPKNKTAEFTKWMGPVLDCLRALGGQARPKEVVNWIATTKKLSEATLEATIKNGAKRFANQVAWARQYLVWENLLDSSTHGVWTLTTKGFNTHLTETESRGIFLKWVDIHTRRRKLAEASAEGTDELTMLGLGAEPEGAASLHGVLTDLSDLPPDELHERELLTVLQSLSPAGFERLCQRLLHASGFENVEVTGKSHDGGIDGIGVLRLNPLVGVKVVFQCKRYKGTVSRAQVGEFRNAILGRAEKGIMFTTGTFSKDARDEATRIADIPIELIDGEKLVDLFENLKLGLKPKTVWEVDLEFFEQYK